jgi:hypothetical protein
MGYRKAKAATEIDVPTVGATTNAPAIPTSTTISTSIKLQKYIDTVAVVNSATAYEYQWRLTNFASFVSHSLPHRQ